MDGFWYNVTVDRLKVEWGKKKSRSKRGKYTKTITIIENGCFILDRENHEENEVASSVETCDESCKIIQFHFFFSSFILLFYLFSSCFRIFVIIFFLFIEFFFSLFYPSFTVRIVSVYWAFGLFSVFSFSYKPVKREWISGAHKMYTYVCRLQMKEKQRKKFRSFDFIINIENTFWYA